MGRVQPRRDPGVLSHGTYCWALRPGSTQDADDHPHSRGRSPRQHWGLHHPRRAGRVLSLQRRYFQDDLRTS